MRQIPNLFTLLNLLFGCMAVVCILQTGEGIVRFQGGEWKTYLPEMIAWGSVWIGLAAVVDFLDGFVARLFNAASDMGRELDSLADVVSFGVAPGLILYQLLRLSFAAEPDGLDVSVAWLLPAAAVPLAAAWRLARFNTDPGQAYGFRGMPTPAAGLLVAALPMIMLYDRYGLRMLLVDARVLYLLIAALAWLMVSDLPLLALKFRSRGWKGNEARWILAAVALCAAVFLQWLAVPAVFVAYIILSLAYKGRTA